jgi:hypothetical protein
MPGLATGARAHVPELGESTVELLVDLLGYSQAQAKACSGEPVAGH